MANPFSSASWLFPGLGCRYVGMGNDLIGQYEVANELIAVAESLVGYDLAEVCLTGSGRKHVPARQEAQVIYILDCAYAAVLSTHDCRPQIAAGHSLGSLAAAWACGAYDFTTGLQLVTHVEELMEELIDGQGLTMGVIIGLDDDAVRTQLAIHPEVYRANWNSPLQHVVAGPVAAVDNILASATAQGAKQAKRFPSERAMHTPYVNEVAARFRERLETVSWSEPQVPLADIHDASVLRTAAEIREFLGEFLAQPVHWQATIEALGQQSNHHFVEVGPGNLLSSMLPFIDRTAAICTASEILDQKAKR
ncbi:MAG: (Acyl-carrier-protein) S-malonyltransferase [Planctomycetaceae bacterium]|nr:(Acyl-carrier-protein) S-malonyltransferase [Planctomycetaceae bacterium]